MTASPNITRDRLQGLNVYLVGMMGAGKSSVGKILARKLEYRFFDTDTLAERVAGRAIKDIFASDGEAAFRELETQVLAQLASCTRSAIATGGGIVVTRKNWSYLHQGVTIWLDASAEILMQRLRHDRNRPLLKTPDPAATLAELLEQRRPLYAQADLHLQILPDDTPTTVASRAIASIPGILKAPSPDRPELDR